MFVATNMILSRQKFCHDKHIFVATKDVYDWRELPQSIILSRQTFCHTKHTFIVTKDVFCYLCKLCLSQQNVCHDKHVFVATNIILLRQAYVCRDKRRVLCFSRQTFCLLSRQKWYLWQFPPMIAGGHEGLSATGYLRPWRDFNTLHSTDSRHTWPR